MKIYFVIFLVLIHFSSFGQTAIHKKIDSILTQVSNFTNEPGLTIGVIKDGKLIYHTNKGYMNLEYNVPFNDSTVFELASVTKQFTAACIGVLEKKGNLSIDDNVRKYIPELNFYGDTIRIKHLLNHTSGIRNHNVLLDLAGFDYKHQGYTNKMIQQLMFRQKGVNNQPGEKMLYSNTNYVLLALIIERVSGIKIHEFAKQEIFDPIGMSSTFYRSDLNKIIKNKAYPYYREKNELKQPKSLTLCTGAGGVVSTISDLALWTQIFITPTNKFFYLGKFLTTLDTLNNGQAMEHARGVFVSPYKNYKTFNHSGRGLGMRSQLICVPRLNIGIIVYTNSEEINAVEISYKILDFWLPKVSKEKNTQKTDYQHKTRELTKFEGYYQELNSDLRMHIFTNKDTLYALSSFGQNPVKLASSTINSFNRIDNPSINYTFIETKTNEANLLVNFGGALFYFEKIDLTKKTNKNIKEYSGNYYSEELDVTYELLIVKDQLVLNYANNTGLILKEGQKDVFGANRRTKYVFNRDHKNQVNSFFVSAEGTVKNILFEKIK